MANPCVGKAFINLGHLQLGGLCLNLDLSGPLMDWCVAHYCTQKLFYAMT